MASSLRATAEAALQSIAADIKALKARPSGLTFLSRVQYPSLSNSYYIPNGQTADYLQQQVPIPAGAKMAFVYFNNHAWSTQNQACTWVLQVYDYDTTVAGGAGWKALDSVLEHSNGGGNGYDIGGRCTAWRPLKPTDSYFYILIKCINQGGGASTRTMMNNISVTWFK